MNTSKILEYYIDAHVSNINIKNIPKNINLILDGGAFNGGSIVGNLLILKQLEKQGHIKIQKISGCSIGALLGLLFIIDKLDCAAYYFKELLKNLRQDIQLNKIKKMIKEIVQNIDIANINKRLYITYNNVLTLEHVVTSQYNSKKDLIEILIQSAYIPILIDGDIRYKNKYCDGFSPYIFNKENIPTLFISLMTTEKVKYMIYTKKDTDIWPRLFEGVEDMYKFFNTGQSKHCNYIEDWNISDFIVFRFREIIITGIIITINLFIRFKNFKYVKHDIYVKRFIKILTLFIQNILTYMVI